MSNGDTHHALYRFYDATGQLLYVGITADPGARWRSHARTKPWWHDVAQITLEKHTTRADVLAAEQLAIQAEQPRYNVVHNSRRYRLPVVLARAEDMPDDCHDICVVAGRNAIYFPYKWIEGCGHYQCAAGHRWTCWWGHSDSGTALQYRGVPHLRLKDTA